MPSLARLLRNVAIALCLAAPVAVAQTDGQTAEAPLEERGYALGDMVIGAEDAPVEIIEYSSLLCPFCAQFHDETFPEIKRRYIDTGQVRFVYRDIFGDQVGLWATMLTRCGGEEAFYESIAIFYAQQDSFLDMVRGEGPGPALQRMGQLIGLSPERLEQCLNDEPFMLSLVEDLQANVESSGVQSTPTFVINGETHTGFRPVDDFAALIEDAL